ncbi:MAG: dihydrofolate reductase family protein [Patescibacteria group bacterium]|nr:dihydrofolate reductase family protein [Patescibacteria group bacterium]
MKVILYATSTINGYIAKEKDETPWSNETWQAYYDLVKEKGNIIVGKRTYEIMKIIDEFEKLNYPFTVVVSSLVPPHQVNEKTIFVNTPREALEVLKSKGFKEVIVGGGGILNSSFLRGDLIDEIYLDLEPLIFGRGIKLFSETETEAKLKLLAVKKITENVLRLHYQVVK